MGSFQLFPKASSKRLRDAAKRLEISPIITEAPSKVFDSLGLLCIEVYSPLEARLNAGISDQYNNLPRTSIRRPTLSPPSTTPQAKDKVKAAAKTEDFLAYKKRSILPLFHTQPIFYHTFRNLSSLNAFSPA